MPIKPYNTDNEAKKDLIISKNNQQPLSKQQQTFNRLIKKIEKLRRELELTTKKLDDKLEFYAKHIHPLEQQLVQLRTEAIKLLFPFFKNKKNLSKKEHEILRELLKMQLNEILSYGKPDEELKVIFKAVNGVSFEKAASLQLEEMRDQMEAMFESFGVDVDLGDLHADMSEEEIMRKVKEMQEQFEQQQENINTKKDSRKKTAKQLQKEEKERQLEEASTRNISKVYKQLAKVLHPDLEQDEDLKIEKEVLMKELTTAYENNDLHSLLRLELHWIHKEEENAARLTNEKLEIYNQVLKEQAKELEEEIYLLNEHPRYEPLARFKATSLSVHLDRINLENEKYNIEESLYSVKVSVQQLKGGNPLREVKELIRIVSSSKRQFDFMDF